MGIIWPVNVDEKVCERPLENQIERDKQTRSCEKPQTPYCALADPRLQISYQTLQLFSILSLPLCIMLG